MRVCSTEANAFHFMNSWFSAHYIPSRKKCTSRDYWFSYYFMLLSEKQYVRAAGIKIARQRDPRACPIVEFFCIIL